MAGRGAHDGEDGARPFDADGRDTDVGVHVPHRHRDAGAQPRQGGGLRRQLAGRGSQRQDVPGELLIHHMSQARVERGEKVVGRKAHPLVPDLLIPRRAGVAGLFPAQLPHDPVRRLDEPVGGVVNRLVFLQYLPHLGDCLLQHRRDRYLQHTNPIARMLERPVVPERGAVGQRCVHDPVGILVYRARALFPRGQIHQHRPAGQGAEVHTKSVKGHITNPFAMALR